MKRIFHDIDQADQEQWLELRRGFITSSNFALIQANAGKAFGNPALEYAMKVAIEAKTNRGITGFTNSWMERGIELEAEAREMYSNLTFTEVTNGGFMEYGRFGSSSDGLTEEGMIEIKCPKYTTHFKRIMLGGFDQSYRWQIRGQMWLYDKQWCDSVSYCPDFPVDKQLYIHRVMRDLDEEKIMIERLAKFVQIVDNYTKHL